jgi:hypothetical protein
MVVHQHRALSLGHLFGRHKSSPNQPIRQLLHHFIQGYNLQAINPNVLDQGDGSPS